MLPRASEMGPKQPQSSMPYSSRLSKVLSSSSMSPVTISPMSWRLSPRALSSGFLSSGRSTPTFPSMGPSRTRISPSRWPAMSPSLVRILRDPNRILFSGNVANYYFFFPPLSPPLLGPSLDGSSTPGRLRPNYAHNQIKGLWPPQSAPSHDADGVSSTSTFSSSN